MAYALRLLARRDHTEREMAARLAAMGYSRAETDEVLARLNDWGYLDDRAVAARAIERALTRRPRGRLLLARELEARGIAAPIVDEALGRYTDEREEEAARAVLARQGLRAPFCAADRARAWRTLRRLGFTDSTIERFCGLADA
ncbi:MAG: regulatory protein RecX [Patescibacteria group bacterium]